jgi:hypothetical protein
VSLGGRREEWEMTGTWSVGLVRRGVPHEEGPIL